KTRWTLFLSLDVFLFGLGALGAWAVSTLHGGVMRGRALAVSGETICPYCGVGCRLAFDGEVGPLQATLKVRGVADAPANLGRICAKGALLGETVATPDRLTQPMVRGTRQEPFRPTTWDAALRGVAQRFRAIVAAHGPDAVAFYGSGQLDTEA